VKLDFVPKQSDTWLVWHDPIILFRLIGQGQKDTVVFARFF